MDILYAAAYSVIFTNMVLIIIAILINRQNVILGSKKWNSKCKNRNSQCRCSSQHQHCGCIQCSYNNNINPSVIHKIESEPISDGRDILKG